MSATIPRRSGSLEVALTKLHSSAQGLRAALYRRDLATTAWVLERALKTLRELYDEYEKPWPIPRNQCTSQEADLDDIEGQLHSELSDTSRTEHLGDVLHEDLVD